MLFSIRFVWYAKFLDCMRPSVCIGVIVWRAVLKTDYHIWCHLLCWFLFHRYIFFYAWKWNKKKRVVSNKNWHKDSTHNGEWPNHIKQVKRAFSSSLMACVPYELVNFNNLERIVCGFDFKSVLVGFMQIPNGIVRDFF